MNALTLIIVFLLLNLFIQRNFEIEWLNKTFTATVVSYILIQMVIIAMFNAACLSEIASHAKTLLLSNEFKYYDTIGLSAKDKICCL
jgi:hypothetical protein